MQATRPPAQIFVPYRALEGHDQSKAPQRMEW